MANPLFSGDFVPTTNIWDVARLNDIEVNSPEFKELLIRLYQNINNIALSLNSRDSGYYTTDQYINGQLYFPNPAVATSNSTQTWRQVMREVVNFGTLPNAATKSVAHNIPITSDYTFTRIYGTASDTTDMTYIPLPYASSTAADNIELFVSATDVVIITDTDYTAYTICYVVLEYLTQ